MNPGIHYDIPIDQYHGDKSAIGSSGMKEILDCPALYYGQNLDPTKPTKEDRDSPAQVFGNLAHCALFEYQHFHERYRVGPQVHSKALKQWVEFKKACEADGVLPIDPGQYEAAMRIRQSALLDADLKRALLHPEGRGEVSAYWKDDATDVLCKCRPDWVMPVNDDAVVLFDGKTYSTGDANEFTRQVPRMNYHLQAAWYSDGYAKASGKTVLDFIFIVIGNEWPHPVNLMSLDEDAMRAGRLKYRRALDAYAQCLRTNEWPGYGPGIKTISLPKWALEEA